MQAIAEARVRDSDADGVLIPSGERAGVDQTAAELAGDLVPIQRRPTVLQKQPQPLGVSFVLVLLEEPLVGQHVEPVIA